MDNLKQEIVDLKGAIETYRVHFNKKTNTAAVEVFKASRLNGEVYRAPEYNH